MESQWREKKERQRKRGRARFDLDVWPQQPTRARERDMRVKERGKTDGGGGSKVLR